MRAFRMSWLLATAAVATVATGTVIGLGEDAAVAQGNGEHEIIVTVKRIRALDKIDVFSKADFFARVTIAGKVVDSPVAKQGDDIAPNWMISHRVKPGVHDVRLEIFDKDVKSADLIDVNRINGRRHLDFSVNTKRCRISGFASGYRCGDAIQRAGDEKKKAEVTFTVDVKR